MTTTTPLAFLRHRAAVACAVAALVAVAGCAAPGATGPATGGTGIGSGTAATAATAPGQPAAPLQSSPECLARNLPSGEPFPASAVPEAALKSRQGGTVSMRYDVVAGQARNIVVVDSRPAGLYDAAALRHAARYREPTGTTVRGCVMTIEVKF